ncbi:CHAT domain-containing protein [[Empedobacter] haloabium]|uniref:CHAT domain-containing protein n=1 Tax=[Empedobacter] haloabium TaxID=592317 RepID=A0ABZ1US06_9BURK
MRSERGWLGPLLRALCCCLLASAAQARQAPSPAVPASAPAPIGPGAEGELAAFGQLLDPARPLAAPGPLDAFNRVLAGARYQILGQYAQVLRLCRYDERVATSAAARDTARGCQRAALVNLERYREAEELALAHGALLPPSGQPPEASARHWHWSATLALNLGQVRVAEAAYRRALADIAQARRDGPSGLPKQGVGPELESAARDLHDSMLKDDELAVRNALDGIAWHLQRYPEYLGGARHTLERAAVLGGRNGNHAELAIEHALRLWQLGRQDEARALAESVHPALRAHAGFRDQPEPLVDPRPLSSAVAALGDERTQPAHVQAWLRLASAYQLAGRLDEAERLLAATVPLARRYMLAPEAGNTLLAEVEEAQGRLAASRGVPADALPFLRRARGRLLLAGASERAAELGRRQLRLDSPQLRAGAAILAALAGGAAVTLPAGSAEEREVAEIASDFAASRAQLSNELADRAARSDRAALAERLRRDGVLVDELVELRGAITAGLAAGRAPDERTAALTRRLAALLDELAQSKAGLQADGDGAAGTDSAALRQRLGTGRAYFQWITHPAGNFALCWRDTGVTLAPLRLPVARIQQLARRVHAASSMRGVASVAALPAFPRADAAALFDALFGPVLHSAAGTRHWLLANSPLVDGIPWGALVTGPPAAPPGWLAERVALTVTPSWRSAVALARRPAGPADRTLLVGDPRNAATLAPPGQLSTRGLFVAAAIGLAPPRLVRTSALARELDTLVRLFPAAATTMLRGPDATKHKLLRLPLERYRLLVFTTHGYLAASHAALLGPSLELTAPHGTLDERLLTAREIAGQRLHAHLVVLSACDTSAPDGYPDSEGLSGLTSAFLLAGARNVVASLWPVETEATRQLVTVMLARYARDEDDIALALQQATLRYLRAADAKRRHPAFWAALLHVGG